jgi:predicted HTH transcriptional regulator
MTLEELEAVLFEIADGATERTELDWKRAWWDFKREEGQHEFLKDISALANADGEETRHILVGVAPGGAVHSAPLPDDEARLQDRLHAITPMPNVSFTPLRRVGGEVVTVVSVAPPFDRPYVAKLGKQNVVLVRIGSSRLTANRARFDRWCGARTAAREQEVERAEAQKVIEQVVDLHRVLCRLRQVAMDVIDATGPPGLAIYGWVDRLPEYDRSSGSCHAESRGARSPANVQHSLPP